MDWVPPALSAAAAAPPATRVQASPQAQSWQERAWAYYRTKGPARQAVNWIARAVSRCHLYVGTAQIDGAGDPDPLTEPGTAGAVLAELHDGQVGQRDMLYRLAVHLLVPGESWLIGYPGHEGDATRWIVASRREWTRDTPEPDHIRLKIPNHPDMDEGGWVEFDVADVVIVPVYDPDPEDASRPTSAFEAALEDLEELDGLSRRVAADINSRLAGAGLLLVSESATMPNPGGSHGVNPLHSDPFIDSLMQAMTTAIAQPDDASAVVPIVARVADEVIGKGAQHVTFSTPFDAQIPVLREHARRALAADLDIPSSIVTGVEDLNHWSAWQAGEDAITTHIGPLLSLICTTITREILWPALRAAGESNPQRFSVWWDAQELVLRPDRSPEAIEAKKLRIISDTATRRELGFSDDDAPNDDDVAPSATDQPRGSGSDQARNSGGQAQPGVRPEPPVNNRARTPDGAAPARQTNS